jgi:hypothetical protein
MCFPFVNNCSHRLCLPMAPSQRAKRFLSIQPVPFASGIAEADPDSQEMM